MGIETITAQDEVVLGLVRNKGISGFWIVTSLHPRSTELATIRAEAEKHAPGYRLQADYGIWGGTRGVRLQLQADEVTLQDAFYDGFERGRQLGG